MLWQYLCLYAGVCMMCACTLKCFTHGQDNADCLHRSLLFSIAIVHLTAVSKQPIIGTTPFVCKIHMVQRAIRNVIKGYLISANVRGYLDVKKLLFLFSVTFSIPLERPLYVNTHVYCEDLSYICHTIYPKYRIF